MGSSTIKYLTLSATEVAIASPGDWLARGWNYVARQAKLQVLASSLAALEATFDFAGNRVDLPFLTLLSIIGVLDQASVSSSFRRIISAMVLGAYLSRLRNSSHVIFASANIQLRRLTGTTS